MIEPTNAPRFFIGSGVLLGYFLVLRVKKIELKTPSFLLIILLLIFYIISALSVIDSFNSADGIFETQKIIFGVLVFLAFYSVLQSENGERKILGGMFLSVIAVLLISLYEFFFNGQSEDLIFQTSLFGHKNFLSSYLFLCLPFVIHYTNNRCGKAKYLPFLVLFTDIYLLISFENEECVFSCDNFNGIFLFDKMVI